MSLDNNSANNFKDFLDAIKPFLNYQLYDMSGMGVEAFQFSTDEKPVGMWTDRKILYAKTIKGTSPSNSTDTVIYTFDSDTQCVAINGALLSGCVPINYTGSNNNWYSRCYVENSNPNRLHLQVVGYTNTPYSITIFYTKTTDSPLASGEKFAGLLSSGSVVYKKTVSTGGSVPSGATLIYRLALLNGTDVVYYTKTS